jgi:hypothetical protein
MIEPGQTSPITAQNNVPNQIVHSKTENVPLARQPSIFEEPGKGNNAEQLEDRRWPEFSLTPQLQKILDFIQTHDVFVDKSGEPGCLERITAQEVSALIRAVETAGLTLGFLKKYWHAPFPGDEEEWFMRTSLGFFCDRFFLIKKLFYRMEAGEKLGGMPLPPSGNLVDIDYAADCFVYEARFRIPFCKDPSEYKNCVGGGEDRMQSGRLTMDRGFKCWRRFENSDGSHGHSQEGLGFCVSIDDPAAVY